MWDLLGPEIKPMFPALAGEFLSTGPPGKSCTNFFRFDDPKQEKQKAKEKRKDISI